MSLLEALAEAVVNVSANKSGGAVARGGGNNGGLFGQAPAQQGGGNMEDLLGSILGGSSAGQSQGGKAQDGLGGLLEQLAGAGGGQGSGGGLDDLLGQLTGGAGGQQGGGLGELIGAVAGALGQGQSQGQTPGQAPGQTPGQGGTFGDLLNQAISNRGTSAPERPQPSAPQEAAAGLMLRAMIQAAKSDGKFDQAEQSKLLAKLGDVDSRERQFVNAELAKPIDVQGLARDVPRGLEAQVYAMSVLGIDLDNQNEAQYLHQLAQAMGIDQQTVNAIHAKLGAPQLYR